MASASYEYYSGSICMLAEMSMQIHAYLHPLDISKLGYRSSTMFDQICKSSGFCPCRMLSGNSPWQHDAAVQPLLFLAEVRLMNSLLFIVARPSFQKDATEHDSKPKCVVVMPSSTLSNVFIFESFDILLWYVTCRYRNFHVSLSN